MPTPLLDQIIQEAQNLTPEERRQLIVRLERDDRTAELRRIQAKHARIKTSSDAFAARKAQEIEAEDPPPGHVREASVTTAAPTAPVQ